MRKTIIVMALAAVCCLSAQAQEKLFNSASVQSPVINKDGTVTFNLYAPKAVKVEVQVRCPRCGSVDGRQKRRVELYHRQTRPRDVQLYL